MILVKSDDGIYIKTKRGFKKVTISDNVISLKGKRLRQVEVDYNSGDLNEVENSNSYIG